MFHASLPLFSTVYSINTFVDYLLLIPQQISSSRLNLGNALRVISVGCDEALPQAHVSVWLTRTSRPPYMSCDDIVHIKTLEALHRGQLYQNVLASIGWLLCVLHYGPIPSAYWQYA